MHGAALVALATVASAVWMVVTAVVWWLARRRPPARVFGERALERFAAGLTDIDDDRRIGDWLAALWLRVDVAVRATWRAEPDGLVDVATGARGALDGELAAWLVAHGEPLAAADLATMRLGPIRPRLEALGRGARRDAVRAARSIAARWSGWSRPTTCAALREAERGLVARIGAGGGARADLRRSWRGSRRARGRPRARSRSPRRCGARRRRATTTSSAPGWSPPSTAARRARPARRGRPCSLADGRLAMLVTEGQAHGVAAALATAALTGAFVARRRRRRRRLDELLARLRASAEAVLRGGEPVAAFVAILDAADADDRVGAARAIPGALRSSRRRRRRARPCSAADGVRLGEPRRRSRAGEAALASGDAGRGGVDGVRGADGAGAARSRDAARLARGCRSAGRGRGDRPARRGSARGGGSPAPRADRPPVRYALTRGTYD